MTRPSWDGLVLLTAGAVLVAWALVRGVAGFVPVVGLLALDLAYVVLTARRTP